VYISRDRENGVIALCFAQVFGVVQQTRSCVCLEEEVTVVSVGRERRSKGREKRVVVGQWRKRNQQLWENSVQI
jgi:hypothetical protein